MLNMKGRKAAEGHMPHGFRIQRCLTALQSQRLFPQKVWIQQHRPTQWAFWGAELSLGESNAVT